MKAVFALVVGLVSANAFATEKYCGVVQVNGVKSFVYAQVLDGSFFPQITGATKDTNKVVKLIKNNNCYCVEGTVDVNQQFVSVAHLYQCNNGPKIK